MFRIALASASVAFVAGSPTTQAPVVINEIRYDDSAADDLEFVELYNATGAPIDIGGWTLESEDATSINFTFTFPGGTLLAPGAHFVIGDAAVPGLDLVLPSSLENSNESVTLRALGGVLVDTVVYEANKGVWNPIVIEGEGLWGNISGDEWSWQRLEDGHDTDNNGLDFMVAPPTPGATNDRSSLLPYVAPMTNPAGTALPGFVGTPPILIDPGVVSALNPSAIPAPPGGGRAAVVWDGTTGGHLSVFDSGKVDNIRFKADVWFESTPDSGTESWSIGLRGTSDSNFLAPNPAGNGSDANGNTGVTWTYERTSTGATLYLIDHHDGGWGPNASQGPRILAAIPITAANDGWQRVCLSVQPGHVAAEFSSGPTAVSVDFVPIAACGGAAYLGYRYFGVGSFRPLTLGNVEYGDRILTVGGSGCQGDCPKVNENPKGGKLTGTRGAIGTEYLFLVKSKPEEIRRVDAVCFFMQTAKDTATSNVDVRIYDHDGTDNPPAPGTGPSIGPVPIRVGSSNDWYATDVGALTPTLGGVGTGLNAFWIGLTVNDEVVIPLLPEGDDYVDVYRRTSGGTAQQSGPWAVQLVCPDPESPAIDSNDQASLGAFLDFQLTNGSPNEPTFLTLGLSDTVWGTFSLPLSLGVFPGVPCAQIRNSIDATIMAVTSAQGTATSGLLIPNDPAAIGTALHAQWIVIKPPFLGIDITPRATVVIQ